ncbi:hypothetical protein MM213_17985 [Belliella sp. R4-6]|uniref:Uncharacterized protein n=1 Tax=Belliella alkalica TaxID=1730871 RepID=A0ABS9VHA0_9BACT|nr:hypothetical protein [Belliella alkalica]MCH7415395.1 hypothetical protein [Belliella alkalica]
MKFFYLSSNCEENGFYFIHERDCPKIPDPVERDYLGPFNNGDEALRRALTINPKAKKCQSCCLKKVTSVLTKSDE